MIKYYNEFINENIEFKINKLKNYNKLIITSVVDFIKDYYKFDVDLIIKKNTNKNNFGNIDLNNLSIKNKKYNLYIDIDSSFDYMIKGLIHELTHIKQVVKNELKVSDDNKYIIWKDTYKILPDEYNKLMADNNYLDYKNVPFEKEAFENMDKLYKLFIKSKYFLKLKGKYSTLDFIIDNI